MFKKHRDSIWDDATKERLRQLLGDGQSAAEIGRRMGVSKNAIISASHRLKLPARPSPIRRGGRNPRKGRPLPVRIQEAVAKAVTQVAPEPVAVDGAASVAPVAPPPVARVLPKVDEGCAWPTGKGGHGVTLYCGEVCEPRKPYCAHHCNLAYARTAEQRSSALRVPETAGCKFTLLDREAALS